MQLPLMCKQSEGISEETPDGQWPPGGVIGMRTQSEGAVEERRNGKCRQGRASGGDWGGAVAVVPTGSKKRKSSSRNGCEAGPSSTVAATSSSSKGVLSGTKERKVRGAAEDGAASSGRGKKKALRGGVVANGVLATIQGSTTSVDARTEATGVFVPDTRSDVAAEGATIEDTGQDEFLIPGLDYDLSLQCLSRVPRSDHGSLKSVCKKWRSVVNGEGRNEVTEARKRDGIKEEWVYMLGGGGHKGAIWRAFDPVGTKWRKLPVCPCDPAFDMCDKESAVAGMQLLVCGQSAMGFTIWRYDLQSNKWSQAPRMLHDRCLFASANTGKYAYFAGGSAQQVTLQLAERYNSETQEWEALPDLHSRRKLCSGCILDGHFLVVGGRDQDRVLTSAEYYDESKNQWVMIENMWPASENAPLVSPAPPLLAVVDNELYAVDATTMELKSYQKDTNTWKTLGRVPDRSVDSSGWGMGFKAVGKDIFVIGGSSDRGNGHFCNEIHACNLESSGGEPKWRSVCHLFFTTGFIYNCTVMTV